ncbi:hypothetical protein EVAR_29330_1 [Eumeta japonica]|uniref:Uncharacterized protein n=1 Tax=Eumeta variegata TaxID=151549 RepID=A0A4C1WHC3_EUMVA|nr:hypothetical protein EVAR_29330_1 [Eumeta japonica]
MARSRRQDPPAPVQIASSGRQWPFASGRARAQRHLNDDFKVLKLLQIKYSDRESERAVAPVPGYPLLFINRRDGSLPVK